MSVRINVDHDICEHCKETIQGALDDVDVADRATVDRATDSVTVDEEADVDTVLAAVENAGFDASVETAR